MTGRADRLHARQPEIPDDVGRGKGREEAAAGGVDMNINVDSGSLLQVVKRGGDRGDKFVLARVRHAEGRYDCDRILVDGLQHPLGIHVEHVGTHRNFPLLDLPVAAKLCPADLDRSANQVRLVGRLAKRLAARFPAPLGSHATEHAGFGRSDGRGTNRGGRRRGVPKSASM